MYKKVLLNQIFKRFRLLFINSDSITKIETKIRYTFKDKELLEQAFTHKSINNSPRFNYERLEFLGDSVLDIVISRELMREFPDGDEGLMTKRRAALVQKPFLANMGRLLNLMDYLKIEKNIDLNIDKIADKQIANIFEALIGALYLDGGIMPCKALILNTVWEHRKEGWKSINYKGKLIEFCHFKNFENPIFKLKDKFGPDHERTFEIQVIIGKRIYSSGFGSNKKTAEQVAAQLALEELGATY
tara:strand:+ start:118 stop:852 length:735 start_codon:yes stop_codon:yes gene_type:complete